MTQRVENIIKGSAQPTKQALEQVFVKKKDGAQLKRLQVDLSEEVGLGSIQI